MRTRTKRLGIVAGLVTGLALPIMATTASSAPTTVVKVGETSVARQAEDSTPTKNWVLYTRPLTFATGDFVTGPATPPLSSGSLQLSTPGSSDKVQLFNFDYMGTPLSSMKGLAYSTYRSAGNLQQVTALNIQVDPDGPGVPGGFTTLVFEPVYNTAQGAVQSGAWQRWDAYNGGAGVWWSTRPVPGVCAGTCYVTWSDIVAANPNATVLGGLGVNQGSGNDGLTSAVDALSVTVGKKSVTYDFENQPASKSDCKNGGWMLGISPSFKNQGACTAAFAK